MKRVRLVHWDAGVGAERAQEIRAAGYRVDFETITPALLKKLRDDPPDAVVVDLSRMPSGGRDVGVALRASKSTRHVPIVFVGGVADKVDRVKGSLPDAAFTSWGRIRSALKEAIAQPPADPVVPGHALAGYSGTPLPKKLGIKPGARVALVGAPRGFEQALGEIPAGARLTRQARGRADLVIWFVQRRTDLDGGIERSAALAEGGSIWIAWPKQTSKLAGDLTGNDVRSVGLAAGLVDYKVCAIDETWSGLLFTRRRRGK